MQMVRTNRINLRLDDFEFELVRQAALTFRLRPAEYARIALMASAQVHLQRAGLPLDGVSSL